MIVYRSQVDAKVVHHIRSVLGIYKLDMRPGSLSHPISYYLFLMIPGYVLVGHWYLCHSLIHVKGLCSLMAHCSSYIYLAETLMADITSITWIRPHAIDTSSVTSIMIPRPFHVVLYPAVSSYGRGITLDVSLPSLPIHLIPYHDLRLRYA